MENLKVTVEEPSKVKRKVVIEVPAEEVDRYFRETFKEYRRQAVLPGFRKGKVPQNVIENRFRGEVTEDVTRKILPESYEQALKEAGLKPISDPEVGKFSVEPGKPLTYTAEVEILPEFEIGNYMGIEIGSQVFDVKEEEVEALLEEIRAGHATVTPITEERGLRTGDVALIDFEGVAEGEPIPGGSAKDFPLTLGSDTFLPGFEDSIIGASVGEEREFFLKLPEDFQEAKMAGMEARFQVTVKEIRERALPALDDEFAKDVGDYESLEALRERLRNNLRHTKEVTSKNEMKDKLIETLVDDNPFEVPPSMIQHRRAMMVANVERNLVMRGMAKEEIEKNRGKIYEDSAVPAERKVRASLLLEAVADKEKIEITNDELSAEIKQIAEQNKISPAEARRRMIENKSLDNLKDVMREEKTVEFLLENAKIAAGSGEAGPSADEPEKGKEQS